MRRSFCLTILLVLVAMVGISAASDESIDHYIKDLKSDNPEIRAKAAYELGCG